MVVKIGYVPLHTGISINGMEIIKELMKDKGFKYQNEAIEYALNITKQETKEYFKKRDNLINSNQELNKTIKLNEEEIKILDEKIKTQKIYQETKEKSKEDLYLRLNKILERDSILPFIIDPISKGTIIPDKEYIISRAFLFAKDNELDETRCIQIANEVIKKYKK